MYNQSLCTYSMWTCYICIYVCECVNLCLYLLGVYVCIYGSGGLLITPVIGANAALSMNGLGRTGIGS